MKKIVCGNFKMNMNLLETEKYIEEFLPLTENCKNEIVIFPSYVNLMFAKQKLTSSKVFLGAQNVSFELNGAYTGEISAEMLKSVGVNYVIVGHSERRKIFLEKNETINKKIKQALGQGLKIILCVGETLDEREKNITFEVVSKQTKIAFKDISEEEAKNVIIAYEPVWAIGTGRTATSEQAEEVCKAIRDVVAGIYSKETADCMTIQYGGSMNAGNADELLSMVDIDGGLIGGASLKTDAFTTIVKAAQK